MSIQVSMDKKANKYKIVMPYDKESASKLKCFKIAKIEKVEGEILFTYERPIKSAYKSINS